MVSIEEEVNLAQRIKKWDMEALEKLTKANLRFVVSVAKQYQNQWLSLSDLINEGNLWLMKAARRFDETRGFKFISYAVWRIRQSILQAIAENSRIVRLPLNKIGSIWKFNQAYITLQQDQERDPTSEELAEALDISVYQVDQMLWFKNHISLDAPLSSSEPDANDRLSIMPDESMPSVDHGLAYKESLTTELERVLNTLSPRESEIIKLVFGMWEYMPLALEDIGDKFWLSRERVRQIKDRALVKLRKKYRGNLLRTFLAE